MTEEIDIDLSKDGDEGEAKPKPRKRKPRKAKVEAGAVETLVPGLDKKPEQKPSYDPGINAVGREISQALGIDVKNPRRVAKALRTLLALTEDDD